MGNVLFAPDTKFPNGSSVLQRLGLLCWWAGNGAVVVTLAIALINAPGNSEPGLIVFIGFGLAVALWLTGRAALFLFASR